MKIQYKTPLGYYFFNKLYPMSKLVDILHRHFSGKVQAGPFKGVQFSATSKWGNLGNKLLGTYEVELYSTIEEIPVESLKLAYDIGSAEGYFAVGMLKRHPQLKLKAWEMDLDSRKLLSENARLNGVENRLEIHETCDSSLLENALDVDSPKLIIMDVEGAEIDLLNERVIQKLNATSCLIETHSPEIFQTLKQRFSQTHQIKVIENRTESIQDMEQSIQLPMSFSFFKKNLIRVINEGRPFPTPWLYVQPKGGIS